MAEDRYAMCCNFCEATKTAKAGTKAYVVHPDGGNGGERLLLRYQSRGGRWITKWDASRRLRNFRIKTIPPEHPRYADMASCQEASSMSWLIPKAPDPTGGTRQADMDRCEHCGLTMCPDDEPDGRACPIIHEGVSYVCGMCGETAVGGDAHAHSREQSAEFLRRGGRAAAS